MGWAVRGIRARLGGGVGDIDLRDLSRVDVARPKPRLEMPMCKGEGAALGSDAGARDVPGDDRKMNAEVRAADRIDDVAVPGAV